MDVMEFKIEYLYLAVIKGNYAEYSSDNVTQCNPD